VTCVRKEKFLKGFGPAVAGRWLMMMSSFPLLLSRGFSVCPVVYDGRLIAHKGGVSGGPLGDSQTAAAAPALLCTIAFNILQHVESNAPISRPNFLFPFISGFSKIKVRAEWSNGRLVNQPNPKSDEQPGLKSVVLTRKEKGSCGLGLRVEL
jgi:hypothetical protein